MLRFTLDTNCVIDVEEGRTNAPLVRQLVKLHRNRSIVVSVSAIGASEKQRIGGYAQTFAEFQDKLKAVGFDSLEVLRPKAYWGIVYWDYCVWADEKDRLERDIHNILFPNIEFIWVEYARVRGLPMDILEPKWLNPKCDVLAMWCHIKQQGDVFVTRDKNFHKPSKKERLRQLGAGIIVNPQEALALASS